jgi:hypothetical protein
MERGIRNEPLDFSSVSQEQPEKYVRPNSEISEREIRKRRKEFQQKLAERTTRKPGFKFTAPRYDQEFERALEKIEANDL